MKKIVFLVLVVCIAAIALAAPAMAEPQAAPPALPDGTTSPINWSSYAPDGKLDPEKINADSAILIDARTGKVLFAKDENAIRYPASTTKIMTCLLALENCKDLTRIVTIGTLPKTDFINDAENIKLKKGEKLTVKQLLYGLMVPSGNDAADAIAQYIGGSIDRFVAMMNQRAKELGMTNTHYTDANGLADDPDHHTTASDMAKLAAAAMQNSEFVRIVSTTKYTFAATNTSPKPVVWFNTNYLIRNEKNGKYPGSYYAYATGIKTGATTMAGNAFVSSAEKDGVCLIGVVLHDVKPRKDGQVPQANLWEDSKTMFEYGFHFFDTVDVIKLLSSESFSEDIKNAVGDDPGAGKLSLLLKPRIAAVYITDTKDAIAGIRSNPSKYIEIKAIYTKDTAPIMRGSIVGAVTFSYQNSPVLVCDLLASRDIAEEPLPTSSATSDKASSGNSAPSRKPQVATPSSDVEDPLSASTGSSSLALVWLAALALLTLVLIAICFLSMRRRSRKYRQYNQRQSNGAKLRR